MSPGRIIVDAFSSPRGRAFDHHSWGVGKLIASLDAMLRVGLIPSGLVNHGGTAETNSDEFKGKDCVFVVDWLKTKGIHKLCSVLFCV